MRAFQRKFYSDEYGIMLDPCKVNFVSDTQEDLVEGLAGRDEAGETSKLDENDPP